MREPHHPSREELDLSSVLHALSDPARLAIVRHLSAKGECSCGHFELGITKATLSHHFRVLREAGVVHARPDGRKRYLSLRDEDVEARFPGLLDAVLTSKAASAQNGRTLGSAAPRVSPRGPLPAAHQAG
jgi:DNA-binding transcriptional ArsR family regulator